MDYRKSGALLLASVLVMALAGCGVHLSRNLDGSLRAQATIGEQALQSEISAALADPSFQRVDVDLAQGVIYVRGERTRPDGGQDWMTFSLYLEAVDGAMRAQVSEVQVNGYDLRQATIRNWNQRIANNLERATRRNPNSELKTAEVTPDGLTLVWRIETARSRE